MYQRHGDDGGSGACPGRRQGCEQMRDPVGRCSGTMRARPRGNSKSENGCLWTGPTLRREEKTLLGSRKTRFTSPAGEVNGFGGVEVREIAVWLLVRTRVLGRDNCNDGCGAGVTKVSGVRGRAGWVSEKETETAAQVPGRGKEEALDAVLAAASRRRGRRKPAAQRSYDPAPPR